MISMPVNVYPSSLSGFGDGVIDATEGLTVSWQFSGEPLARYRIVICQNDTQSTQVYDTGIVVLDAPFYPTNSKGIQQTFYANEISAEDLASAGIVNGYENGYKLFITMIGQDGTSVTQLSASVFITRDKPTLTINAIEQPYTKREIEITASYAQAQGDKAYNVQWFFVDTRNYDNYLINTGILETSLLELSYDGLLTDTTYAVRAIVETENGVKADTGWVEFYVSYKLAPSQGLVNLCRAAGAPYIQVSWANRTKIYGRPEGTGSYTTLGGILRITEGESIIWDENNGDELSFAKPWSLAWRGQISDYTNPVQVVELSTDDANNPYILTVTQSSISFAYNGQTIFSQAVNLLPNDWLVVVITKDGWAIKQVTHEGGLVPQLDLYPNGTLYPAPVSRVINNFSGDCTYEQVAVHSVQLNGLQTCEYVWLYYDTFNDGTISNMVSTSWYEPAFDENTYLIATFSEDDLSADISGGNGDTLYGASIYRQEGGEAILKHVADIEPGYLVGRDYGAVSNKTYTYYVFQRGGETYTSQPYQSTQITPRFSFYTLMECELQSDGFYHVLHYWSVAGNLSTGAISNNNKPNTVENFTKYPTWQPTNQNYKSGTLTALIGTFSASDNSYSDSWELANEIQNLSVSTNPKFLKDAKGAIWMIEPNGAITMNVDDKSGVLPIKMSFPWVEVGDANDDYTSIISVPGDEIWETDDINKTSITINPATGQLEWTVPDNYSGSNLKMNSGGELIQTGTGFIEPAQMEVSEDGYLLATE